MTNSSVKPALERIEKGILEIKEQICEIIPCKKEEDVDEEKEK